MMDNKVI